MFTKLLAWVHRLPPRSLDITSVLLIGAGINLVTDIGAGRYLVLIAGLAMIIAGVSVLEIKEQNEGIRRAFLSKERQGLKLLEAAILQGKDPGEVSALQDEPSLQSTITEHLAHQRGKKSGTFALVIGLAALMGAVYILVRYGSKEAYEELDIKATSMQLRLDSLTHQQLLLSDQLVRLTARSDSSARPDPPGNGSSVPFTQ